jgi:hypothetical protein
MTDMNTNKAKSKCKCGSSVRNLTRHQATKKHQDWCARNAVITEQSSDDELDKIQQQIQEYEHIIMNAQNEIIKLRSKLQKHKTPSTLLSKIIEEQRRKEEKNDLWINSFYRDITKLQSNNVGIVGEKLIQGICSQCNIKSNIDGSRMKTRGGGAGDGPIKDKSCEVKTAHLGISGTFQHELGEHPWKSNYLVFVDITPESFFLTILKNFTESHYKCKGSKCAPHFPNKTITRRKEQGNFKFDTSVKLNRKSSATIEITKTTTMSELGEFINTLIV